MTWRDYVPSIDLRKWLRSGGRTERDSRRSRRSSSFSGSPSSQRSQPDRSLSPRSRRSCCSSCSARRSPARAHPGRSSPISLSGGRRPVVRVAPRPVGRTPPTALDDPLTARYYSIVTTGSVEMRYFQTYSFKTETAGRSRLRIARGTPERIGVNRTVFHGMYISTYVI